MAKLNQLIVPIVLKVKQLQNLEEDSRAVERWAEVRQKELEALGVGQEVGESPNNSALMNNTAMNESQMHMLQEAAEEADWRGNYLPGNLDNSILFTKSHLTYLIERKRVLDEEYVKENVKYREYRDTMREKKKKIKENENLKKKREEEYKEKQMLRFGDLYDLDSLEVGGPSQTVFDLQNRFNKKEKDCFKKIEEADTELEQTQRQLTQAIKNNTGLLNLIIKLGKDQIDYNNMLDQTKQAIHQDENEKERRNIMLEKQKLKEALEMQAKEIETLKTEINLYKRKGGHIYTKVTTNRRVANLAQNVHE